MTLKQDGPQEAGTLAAQFGLTDMAVRQHLYALEKQGDICHSTRSRPRGRPAKIWHLTDRANSHFPDTHAEFSTGLIASIQEVFGPQGMDRLLEQRLRSQITEYRAEIPASLPLKDKLEKLAAIRSREGYMADIISLEDRDGYLFIENNCPVCAAAKACSGICVREMDLFREILGRDIHITRTEHITLGARRCAYEISQA